MEDRDAYTTQRIINSLFFEQENWWMAERLAELMAGLMMDPKYSDLTLECEGEKFAVHKAVVLTQSVVLEKALQGPWKEGVDNVIHITEFDAQTVRRMVEFLYTGDYDQGKPEFVSPAKDDESPKAEDAEHSDGDDDVAHPLFERQPLNPEIDIETLEAGIFDITINANPPSSPSPSELVCKEWGPDDEAAADQFFDAFSPQLGVHAIADYYMLKGLNYKAIEKVKVLLKKTIWSAKGFLAVAKEAFETTFADSDQQQQDGETLRDIIVDVASSHFTEITRTKDFARSDLNPEFAALLLQKAADKYESARAELEHQERDNLERWMIDCRRISELMSNVGHLQAQNAELEDCIKRIQELTTCQVCGCPFNVLVREEGPDQSNDNDVDGDDAGYDADGSVDGFASAVGGQQQVGKAKKYVIECKKCNSHGMRSGDLFRADFDALNGGDELFPGIAEPHGDDLPAEPWLQGDNDLFAGVLYPDDDDDV